MKDIVNTYVNRFLREKRRRNRQICTLLALAALVVFGVFWNLHYTGIALANEASCGLEEHTHSDECYEEQTFLTCGMEESEEHTHGDSCYSAESVLICGKEEHVHTSECYISDSDEDGEETGTEGESTNGGASTDDTGNSSGSESTDGTNGSADSDGENAEGADSGNAEVNAASETEQSALTEGVSESNGNVGLSLASVELQELGSFSLSYVSGKSITIEPDGYAGNNTAVLELSVTDKNYTIVSPDRGDTYYSYLTDQKLELTFEISGGQPENYTYRIYFEPKDLAGLYSNLSAEQASSLDGKELKDLVSFSLNTNNEVTLGSYTSGLYWDDSAGAYYLEFAVASKDTASGTLKVTYPSPNTPGGDLVIYGVIYDNSTGNIVSNISSDDREAFLATWTTDRQEFDVFIENDSQQVNGLIMSGNEDDGIYVAVTNNPDQPIIWNITMKESDTSREDESIGEDFITGISVTDTIQLPTGITWIADMSDISVDVGDDGYITFSDAKGNVLLELVNKSNNTVGEDSSFTFRYDSTSNSLIITWEISNANIDDDGFATSEIDNGDWQVRLNGDYLTYSDTDGKEFAAQSSHVITNTVVYDYHYTWSDDRESTDDTPIEINISDGDVILTKTADRSSEKVYMGQDAYYTISLYNESTQATTDLASLNDSALSKEQYISPENIWKMFFLEEFAEEADPTSDSYDRYLATDSGDYLTITITNALVYYDKEQDLETLTDVEGNEGTVYKTNANFYTGHAAKYKDATIIITKVEGESTLHVEFWNKELTEKFYYFDAASAEELELGFLLIGYTVSGSDTYSAVWNLENNQLKGGETRHYKVYSSLKNTFQYYGEMYENQATAYNVADNVVYLEFNDGSEKSAAAEYTSIDIDFRVEKEISAIDEEYVSGDTITSLYSGSFVQYTIRALHFCDGEAEDVTLMDVIYGGQILLVPLNDRNIKEIQNGNWGSGYQFLYERYGKEYFENSYGEMEIDGTVYVRLIGTQNQVFYNVWFDDYHCAAYVDPYYSRSYGSGYATQIVWCYDNQMEESGTDTISYWVLVSTRRYDNYYTSYVEDVKNYYYSAYNMVYLGAAEDNYVSSADRAALYDGIDSMPIVSGELLKQILMSDRGADAENETYATSSQIDLNERNGYSQSVLYKLELNTNINGGDVVFSNVLDVLPYTYGEFEWTTENVDVYQYVYATGEELGYDVSFEIYYSDENGDASNVTELEDGSYVLEDGTPAYQSIRWYVQEGDDKTYALTVPSGTGGIWIYVELTFSMSETAWSLYADQVEENLRNTLSAVIGDNEKASTSEVLHSVKKDAKAYLQKGVYWIENSMSGTDLRELYYSASDSSVSAGESDGSVVAYYITIYNPGSAYLYLTEIQDLVPEGFELIGVTGSTSRYEDASYDSFANTYTNTYIGTSCTTSSTDPVAEIEDAEEDIEWMTAIVKAEEGEDGVLRYTFSNSSTQGNLGYSDSVGLYYLDENEAISFIVVFAPGTDEETDVYATNTIAMPYVDFSGDGVVAGSVSGTAVDKASGTSAKQNVGGCEVISETEALAAGFQTVETSITSASTDSWLTSEVTVHRGEIIPGIKKTASPSTVSGDETVTWYIEVTNDGTIPMVNYTIEDSLDYPYQFLGNMILTIYDENDDAVLQTFYMDDTCIYTYGSMPFLKIDSRGTEDFEYTTYYCIEDLFFDYETKTENYGSLINFGTTYLGSNFAYLDEELGWRQVSDSADWSFSIDQDDEGNDLLTLILTDEIFAIPAGGKLELSIETIPSVTPASGVYYNEATVTPVQSYNDDAVTSGEAVPADDSTGSAPYVKSSDFVVVNGGYSTSSQKWIQNIEDEETDTTKIANSEVDNLVTGVRYIVLDDEKETFRYTLEVTNNLSSAMNNLVVVDVLPEIGDNAPFTVQNSKTARNSEFQVDLLLDENGSDSAVKWEVVIGTKKTVSTSLGNTPAIDTIEVTDTLKRVQLDENYATTATSGYIIYYSTYSDFTAYGGETISGVGMTSNPYANPDAKDVDGNRIWTTNPTGARSILIVILDEIGQNDAVQISFNAKVSDDTDLSDANKAEPGEIAWNSFAYMYTTASSSSQGDTETLWAAPRKVGVMIPDVPKLQKTLSNIGEDESVLENAQVFRFLVHEGDQLTIKDGEDTVAFDYAGCTETELIAALTSAGREYFVITLTVPANSTTSEVIDLDPEKAETPNYNFVYKAGETYTIVELPNGSDQPGNNLFTSHYMDVNGDDRVDANVLMFKYTSGSDYILITADNVYSEEEGGYELPLTGGVGTLVHTTAGLLLSGGAACLMYKKKKREGGCAS